MDKLIELGRIAFATHYHYLLKAQNFHWNVTGIDFLQYHELFGDIYEELEDKVDEFAEHIRGIHGDVPASFTYLAKYSTIKDPAEGLNKLDMVYELYKDNAKIVKALMDAYSVSELENEYGFSSFLADRISEHRKHGWQLYSSMPV